LVFVSSYRATWDVQNNDYHRALSDAHQTIFNHLLRFAKVYSIRIVVLAKGKVLNRGEHFTEEEEFYRKLANGADYTLVSSVKDTTTSYRTVFNANLVIAIDSTLAYEMLSVGKKAIFGWVSNASLKAYKEPVRYTQYLPTSLVLYSEKYDEFHQKVSALIDLPPEEYDVTIKHHKSKYVNQDINNPPHMVIEREIRSHIEQDH